MRRYDEIHTLKYNLIKYNKPIFEDEKEIEYVKQFTTLMEIQKFLGLPFHDPVNRLYKGYYKETYLKFLQKNPIKKDKKERQYKILPYHYYEITLIHPDIIIIDPPFEEITNQELSVS